MAYEERIYFTHNTLDWGSTFRISLLDRDWPAINGSDEVTADSPVFTLRYDEQPSLTEPFMASALTAFFKIDNNATLINDLLTADDDRFVLTLRIGLNEVWRGGVVPSAIIYEDDGQNVIPVTAGCGINRMQQFSFDPKGGAVNVRQLLNHYLGAEPMSSGGTDEVGYSYAIPWQEASVNPLSEPVFDNLSINTNQFIDGDQQDPQPVTQSLFLENILRRFTARMYRWGSDEFKIESLDASNTAWGTVKSVNSTDWARGLNVSHLYPFAQAKLNYFHNTGLGGFDAPTAGFELDENGYDKTISYEALATDLLTVGGNVSARLDSIANYASSDVLKFDWRVETDNHYWNGSRWISGSGANTVTLVDSNNTTFRAGYFRSIANFSGHPDVDGITQLRFAVSAIYREFNTGTGKAPATATRNFYDLTAEIDTETQAGATNRSTYANADNNATQTYDHGTLRLGDGFVEFTPNGMFPSNRTDFTFTEAWTNNVHSTAEDIDNLTLRTIMGYQYGLRKMIRGTLQVPYEPTQTLVYDGKNYRFAGGTLDANGFWSGTWIEKRYEAPTLSFTRYNEGVIRSTPIDFGDVEQTFVENQLAEVNASATGTVTSITVTDVDLTFPLRAGSTILLKQAANLANTDLLTLSAPFHPADTSINVFSTALSHSYVVGDIVQVDTAKPLDAVAVIGAAGVSGTGVTSIPLKNLTIADRVRYKNSIYLVKAGDISQFDRVTLSSDLVAGDTSATVSSVDLTYSYVEDDYVVINGEGLSYSIGDLADEITVSTDKIADINAATNGTVTSVSIANLDIRDALRIGTTLYLIKATNTSQYDKVVLTDALDVADTTISIDSIALTYSYTTSDFVALDISSISGVLGGIQNDVNKLKVFSNSFIPIAKLNETLGLGTSHDRFDVSNNTLNDTLLSNSSIFLIKANDYTQFQRFFTTQNLNSTMTNFRVLTSTMDFAFDVGDIVAVGVNVAQSIINSQSNSISSNTSSINTIESLLTTNDIDASATLKTAVEANQSDLTSVKANVVLNVDVNGNVGTVDLSSGVEGSSFEVLADKIKFTATEGFEFFSTLGFRLQVNVLIMDGIGPSGYNGACNLEPGRLRLNKDGAGGDIDIDGNSIQFLGNGNSVLMDNTTSAGVLSIGSSSFEGKYRSSDGTAGGTNASVPSTATLQFKDGLYVGHT